MPQVTVNSSNIDVFKFKATFNIYNREVTFDTSNTTYNGSGIDNVLGISFSLIDQDGVELTTIDFTDSSKYIVPSTTEVFTLDLTSLPYAFLFQNYKIIGAIKDSTGIIYYTEAVYKKVCQPVNFNNSGYVSGTFQLSADCTNNTITVKEITNLTYNNLSSYSTSKSGTFYYPTGTISPISFANTPFTNNEVYTGQNRIECQTDSTYDLNDDIFVVVTYITKSQFDITCARKMSDLFCCLFDLQEKATRNCDNAIGKYAQQQLNDISVPLMLGIMAETFGKDSSEQYAFIKKKLNCDCGTSSIGQNEADPINPAVYNIVIEDAGATTVTSSTIGTTKNFTVASNAYQVVKANNSDTAFTITQDTSTQYVVKYKIGFNYDIFAGSILDAIAVDSDLLAQLNALLSIAGVDLTGLDGKCVIDLSEKDYTLTFAATSSTIISNIVIDGTIYVAPSSLHANSPSSVQSWLNTLSKGTFACSYSGGNLTILALNNPNTISTLTITSPDLTLQFSTSMATLVEVLQAIIDYLCGITALQIALANAFTIDYLDYNGNVLQFSLLADNTQNDFNVKVVSAINSIVYRINTLTGITCEKISALFADNLASALTASGRVYGNDGNGCISWTPRQLALGIINTINTDSTVKTAYCAIDCSTPATCPDISNISISMAGSDIGIYGVTFNSTPQAVQTTTVKYRITGTLSWTTATNALSVFPNGNLVGTSPYLIVNPTAGQTYDVWIQDNCGGVGFVKQITIPTGTIYSGSYLLDSVIYNICGDSPITLYSSAPFATGVTMYTDIGLTIPVTGYSYIVSSAGGDIYQINTSTGVVGIDTGTACTTGTAGSYKLGNNTSTICAGSSVTLYTNGAFAVGGILYNDISLTSPVTGYSYVVNNANASIYNLNSVSGQIGASTGSACLPSLTLTSNTDTGPGGTRTEEFLVGANVAAGNRFGVITYSHTVEVIAVLGDDAANIALKLVNAVNATTESQWNEFGSAPPHGTNGFPPTATDLGGGAFRIVLNYQNSFAYYAYIN